MISAAVAMEWSVLAWYEWSRCMVAGAIFGKREGGSGPATSE
jgi:hypothetical protein